MGKLIYFGTTSFDGYIEDASGSFDWFAPDEEVHAFINDCLRSASVFLQGRLMHEIMTVWETDEGFVGSSPITRDFAQIWRAADKIVYSATLNRVATARTRIERRFDQEALRSLKAETDGDIVVGGSLLASAVWRAGLVDECRLFLAPCLVGGGKPAVPDGFKSRLELLESRSFQSGAIYLHYRLASDPGVGDAPLA